MKKRSCSSQSISPSREFIEQFEEVVTFFLCGKPMSEAQKARLVSEFAAVVSDQMRRRLDATCLN